MRKDEARVDRAGREVRVQSKGRKEKGVEKSKYLQLYKS